MKCYIEYLDNRTPEEITFKKFLTTIEEIALVIKSENGDDIRYIPKSIISRITIYDLKA